jgi:uncharacterized protein (TIGR03435 family)
MNQSIARTAEVIAFTVPLVLAMWNAPALRAQSETIENSFEVVTIKPSQEQGVHLFLDPSGLFHPTGTTLGDLIKLAYDLHDRQIIGGPSWLGSEKYDLFAKPEKPGRPSLPQLKVMLQKLMAERFQLAFHREKRELSVYIITVAKSGPKLTRNDSDPSGTPQFSAGPRAITVTNGTMADFANTLQHSGNILDRPVVDQTGLGSTRYDLVLKWTPLSPQGQAGGGEPHQENADAPDLFTAFQQQLGLKLESAKAPVDVMVVDRAEKPREN